MPLTASAVAVRLGLTFALSLVVAGCGGDTLAPAPGTPLVGHWGGEEAGLVALQGVAEIGLNCGAAVSIPEPLVLDSAHAFQVAGLLVGMNARVPPSVAVSGTVSGNTLTLTLAVPTIAEPLQYLLRAGAEPHFAAKGCMA